RVDRATEPDCADRRPNPERERKDRFGRLCNRGALTRSLTAFTITGMIGMDPPDDRAATARARARAHWNVAIGILAVNGGLYLTLILLIAYQKTLLGRILVPGLSL